MVDYFERLHRAVLFIEERLNEDIGFREVAAEAAYVSPWHFHRIFEAVLGLTVTEYIRERRLSVAALRLVETEARVIDIAMDARYDSQEAFTRAFKRRFGLPPGRYRERGVKASLPSREPYTVKALRAMAGGMVMEPRIERKEAFSVVGLAGKSSQADNRIPALWAAFLPRAGEVPRRKAGGGSYGICEYLDPSSMSEDSEWTEFVGVEVEDEGEPAAPPAGMVRKTLPGRRYAVFTHKGALDSLGETYDYIYKTYIPRSGLALAEAEDFELYDDRFTPADPANSRMFIYIPLAD
ncbi:MAG: AraC family transcriptional regulator [Spirochaetaceae bacterium]|nr:AraC family transcriptional regulator [Spirochaetaceae bacterium]